MMSALAVVDLYGAGQLLLVHGGLGLSCRERKGICLNLILDCDCEKVGNVGQACEMTRTSHTNQD